METKPAEEAQPSSAIEDQPHDDDDIKLALQLHRELNAPQRRPRHQQASNAATQEALKRLTGGKRVQDASSESADSGSSSEDEGDAAVALQHRGSSPEEARASHPGRRPAKRPPGKSRLGRPPTKPARQRRKPALPHEAAAAAALRKAAAAGGGGRSAAAAAPAHFKCFVAGVPWGAVLPAEACSSREALAEAVTKVFERDGFACAPSQLDVTVVLQDKTTLHFPAARPPAAQPGSAEERAADEQAEEAGAAEWSEGTLTGAARVYITSPSGKAGEGAGL